MAVSVMDETIKSLKKMHRAMKKLNESTESGLESLRNINDYIEERDQMLRESVTEEDVLDFMKRSMLPYDEAKKYLQDARAAWPWEGEEDNDGIW